MALNISKLKKRLPKFNFDVFEKITPVLLVATIALAFIVGMLWEKVRVLEKGGTTYQATTAVASSAPAAVATTSVTLDQVKGLFGKDLIKFGDANKKVLFVEIADPSCPYCHIAGGHDPEQATGQFKYVSAGGTYAPPVPEMKKLVDAGLAGFVYIYFPGHGNGEMGMKALLCANEKGKFWEAHDLIMSNAGYALQNTTVQNDKTKSQVVADFLKGVVDPTFLKSCLDSGKYDSRLTSDSSLSQSLGVQGTPGFFINASSYPGAYSWTDMKATVDAALK